MPTMVDKTGATVEVPEEQLPQAFLSGQYGVAPGQDLHGYDDNGDLQKIAPEELGAYLQKGGTLASQKAVHEADLQAKYGGLGGTLAAAGEGAARGLTLGVSDPLAVGAARLFGGHEAAEHVRTHLAEEKEANPWAATGGEVLGAVAPLILSGGASAPEQAAELGGRAALELGSEAEQAASVFSRIGGGARTLGAYTPPSLVSRAGEAGEGLVGAMLGNEATSTLGKAGLSAAKSAARGIVEGGLFSGGQEISDATLENRDLTAEHLLASVGHGALMGGALGGALGGLGSLASSGARSVAAKLSPELDEQSAKQATKWLEPSKADSKLFDARHGGDVGIGEVVRDDILRPAIEEKGLAGAVMTPEEKLDATIAARQKYGAKLSELLSSNEDATVKLGDMFAPIDERIDEYGGKLLGEDKVKALNTLKESMAEVLGVKPNFAEIAEQARDAASSTGLKGEELIQFVQDHIAEQMQNAYDEMASHKVPIKQAIEQRRALQQVVYQETKQLDPKLRVQLLREVSGAWGDLEEKALNEVSAARGGAAGDELKALNDRYSKLKAIEGALENNRARYQTNRHFSLSDNMHGAAVLGGAVTGGHSLIGAAGALAVAQGHKLIREHGNAYASILLDRLATWGGVSRAVAETNEAIDGALSRATSQKSPVAIIGKKAAKGVTKTGTNENSKEYDRQASRIRSAVALGSAVVGAHVSEQLAPVSTHAPELAQAVADKHAKALAFLQGKLPPTATATAQSLQPDLQKDHVSAPDKAKFLRYVNAVEDGPAGIVKRLGKGQITAEDIETLKDVYPASYADVRQKAMQACAEKKSPVPYQSRLRFGRLLDFPADASMTPEFAQVTAKAWASAPKAEAEASGGGKGSPSQAPPQLSIATQMGTPQENVQKEGEAA